MILDDILRGSNSPSPGSYTFIANTHQRYESGIPVRGEQVGVIRNIKIEKNISGNDGYTVSITPSMSTKPMKITRISNNCVYLQGYGHDQMALMLGIPEKDASFANYAMSIYFEKGTISHCKIHLLDRGVDIDYYNL